jgi:hypothetical protein
VTVPPSPENVSRNLLRAQSAASRVPPKILTYAQVCSGFRLPPLLAAWAPRDDFWTHFEWQATFDLIALRAVAGNRNCHGGVSEIELLSQRTQTTATRRLHQLGQ